MKSVVVKGMCMVQPIDFTKPVYNAVNINIKKPEVNAENKVTNPLEVNFDNGIYNAVKIDIDNPKVNTQPKQIYDYPEAKEIVTYDMLSFHPIEIPAEVKDETVPEEKPTEEVVIPEPNYTTLEAEKAPVEDEEKKTENLGNLTFHGISAEPKKPEIVPSEDILPNVDVNQVIANLSSEDKDVQDLQMEEIIRLYTTDKKLVKDFVVSDVFTNLINITKVDSSRLAPPTKEQGELRIKFIENWAAATQDPNAKLPHELTDEQKAYAFQLSPLELVQRNKEDALTSLGALAELFIEDYQDKEGRVPPITDTPGIAAIVDALRKNPDPGVKLSAIDALRHIARPEYKKELEAIFTITSADKDPIVSKAAIESLAILNNI